MADIDLHFQVRPSAGMLKYHLPGGTWPPIFVSGIAMAHSSLRYLWHWYQKSLDSAGFMDLGQDTSSLRDCLLVCLSSGTQHLPRLTPRHPILLWKTLPNTLSKALLVLAHGCPCLHEPGLPQPDEFSSLTVFLVSVHASAAASVFQNQSLHYRVSTFGFHLFR